MWIRIDCIRIRIRIHKVGSIRIQVHKISKFSKHLLIFESKKKLLIFKSLCTYFFKGSELKHIISCENKDFCWLNSAFPFILSVILYLWIRIQIRIRNPDPDPHHWTKHSYTIKYSFTGRDWPEFKEHGAGGEDCTFRYNCSFSVKIKWQLFRETLINAYFSRTCS